MAGKHKADEARAAAVAALVRIHKGAYANLVAQGVFDVYGLGEKDRAFASAVFLGSVERLATLDFLLRPLLRQGIAKLDVEVRAILEAGLYQLLYMRVPARAAVDESVKLARAFGKSSAAGLVNAVLRKASAQYETQGEGPIFAHFAFCDEAQRVQVVHSVGPAVAAAVMEALPEEYDAYLAACHPNGEVCLRVNTLKTGVQALEGALAVQGVPTRRGAVEGCLYARFAGGVAENPLFVQGLFHVQGEASQFACACVGAGPGRRVLDVCAAPGGKSATLAQAMGGGQGLTACEVRENRLPLINDTFGRLGIGGAKVVQNDAAVYSEAFAGQDRVLCDVPCSGLGVLAAKPDLRYADGRNFEQLPQLQLKILQTASRYLTQGGRLIYSTCTIRGQENAGVVRRFLAENQNFRLARVPAPQGAVVEDGMVTVLPHFTGMDGFFVATMDKI